jgi:adenine phosphoribosyltransferase
LLQDAAAFDTAVRALADQASDAEVVCGIDARGFILGGAVAFHLGVGFVPIRKRGKLPGDIEAVAYSLEYGEDHLEVHRDALTPGQRVVVVDDVLATGGTAAACVELVERLGGEIVAFSFLLELAFLSGRAKLESHRVDALLVYTD